MQLYIVLLDVLYCYDVCTPVLSPDKVLFLLTLNFANTKRRCNVCRHSFGHEKFRVTFFYNRTSFEIKFRNTKRSLYTRYPIVARALGLVRLAFRPSARASKGILHTKTFCAFNCIKIIKSIVICNIKSGKIKLSFKLGAWLAYVIYDRAC